MKSISGRVSRRALSVRPPWPTLFLLYDVARADVFSCVFFLGGGVFGFLGGGWGGGGGGGGGGC